MWMNLPFKMGILPEQLKSGDVGQRTSISPLKSNELYLRYTNVALEHLNSQLANHLEMAMLNREQLWTGSD